MNQILFKFLLAVVFASGIDITFSAAQGRVIVKLDDNKKPILNESFGTHRYTRIMSTTPDSTSISKVYDLQNRLLSVTREKFNPELGYNEAKTATYDTLQNLVSSEIMNVENGSFIKVFLDKQEVVSRLEYMEGKGYQFFLGNSETPTIQSDTNPMEPQARFEMDAYRAFLSENLRYPVQAREKQEMGTVLLQIDFDNTGKMSEINCLNQHELYPALVVEAIRVVRAFNPSFIAPIDIRGNRTTCQAKLPIVFRLKKV